MPLEQAKSIENYVKVHKLFISSSDRTQNSVGPYIYEVDLNEEIQNVIAIEVTGYNFPSNIAPTFVEAGAGFSGTNKLDFEIQGPTNTVFTATWPSKQYTYENVTVPYLSYVQVLAQIMNEAIASDALYGTGGPNEARFIVTADPEEVTSVRVVGAGVTGFRFLFASGPNSLDSCFNAMGYNQADTAVAMSQRSPGRTLLRPFRFFDVNIEQVPELSPLKRIYATNNLYYGSVRNDPCITRTRLLSSKPLRRVQRLGIRITLEGGVVPPVFEGRDHELTLTVFALSNEVTVPGWVRQLFVL